MQMFGSKAVHIAIASCYKNDIEQDRGIVVDSQASIRNTAYSSNVNESELVCDDSSAKTQQVLLPTVTEEERSHRRYHTHPLCSSPSKNKCDLSHHRISSEGRPPRHPNVKK
jgi:hypothetical protein